MTARATPAKIRREARRRAHPQGRSIVEVDHQNRSFDFHSLRGTFGTNLAKVTPKAAQELTRHSDINLTMQVYTSLDLADVAAHLQKLPDLPAESEVLRATGTEDGTSEMLQRWLHFR